MYMFITHARCCCYAATFWLVHILQFACVLVFLYTAAAAMLLLCAGTLPTMRLRRS